MTIEVKVPPITKSSELQALIEKTGDQPARYTLPAGTITIDAPLELYDYTDFAGMGRGITTFKLMKNAPLSLFQEGTPLIGPKSEKHCIGLKLHDFSIDGNYLNQSLTPNDHGVGYGNMIGLGNILNPAYSNSQDCSFYNLDLSNSEGDGIRVEGGKNISIHDITSKNGGHDIVCLAAVDTAEVYGLNVDMRSNAAIRTRSANDIKIHDNVIRGTRDAYSPGIEIQSTAKNWITSDIDIYNNKIFNTFGPGIQVASDVPNNGLVKIHHNLITGCGAMPASSNLSGVGGIVFDGVPVQIEYNTLYKNYGYGILCGAYNVGSTYRATSKIRYNIITNTQKSFSPGVYSGTGIANWTGSRNTITVDGNCQYGNKTANHYGVVYTNSISKDPIFVDTASGDCHLKSIYGHYTSSGYVPDNISSPCINFSTKAEIGVYNSSQEASKYEPVIDPKSLPSLVLPRTSKEDAEKLLKLLKDMGVLTDKDYYYFLNTEA
jgi:hypothetical protein